MSRCISLLLSIGLALAPLPVLANVPPDLIRLKDGGMLRGTIVEMVPGEKVTISLFDGELRTLPMSDVDYAGAADAAPTTSSAQETVEPMVTVRTEKMTLKLRTPGEKLTWHLSESAGVAYGPGGFAVALNFRRLCTSPCEAELPAGSHRLALAKQEGFPITAIDPLDVSRDGELVGHYDDNSTTRAVILIAGIAAVLGGTALMISPLLSDDESADPGDDDYEPDDGLGVGFYAGLGVMFVGALSFSFMPGDEVRIEYVGP